MENLLNVIATLLYPSLSEYVGTKVRTNKK